MASLDDGNVTENAGDFSRDWPHFVRCKKLVRREKREGKGRGKGRDTQSVVVREGGCSLLSRSLLQSSLSLVCVSSRPFPALCGWMCVCKGWQRVTRPFWVKQLYTSFINEPGNAAYLYHRCISNGLQVFQLVEVGIWEPLY